MNAIQTYKEVQNCFYFPKKKLINDEVQAQNRERIETRKLIKRINKMCQVEAIQTNICRGLMTTKTKQHLQALLAISFILLCFGIAGNSDYEEELRKEAGYERTHK